VSLGQEYFPRFIIGCGCAGCFAAEKTERKTEENQGMGTTCLAFALKYISDHLFPLAHMEAQ
jgi:hypothetical protein